MTAEKPTATEGRYATSIDTRARLNASPSRVWSALMLYEDILDPPPVYLRLLLPIPIRTRGRAHQVGDEVECLYETGRLVKRIHDIEPDCHYRFEVVEQSLTIGGNIRLSGGGYALYALADGTTELRIETRYVGGRRPRRLWRPIEALVCKAFHRHLLSEMRRRLESSSIALPEVASGGTSSCHPPG